MVSIPSTFDVDTPISTPLIVEVGVSLNASTVSVRIFDPVPVPPLSLNSPARDSAF